MSHDHAMDPLRPLAGPQSGVYSSTISGKSANGTAAVALKLSYQPIGTDDVIRVNCEGQLSMRGRPFGADPLIEILGPKAHTYRMIFSLASVSGAETSGLAWLLQTGEKVNNAGGKLIITHMSPLVAAPLEMLQIDLPFRVAVTDEEAVAAAMGR